MSRTATNLEQQRKRAKDLVRAHRTGDEEAARRIATYLPRARGLSIAQVVAANLALSEAQFVVAREAGYASWPVMKHALAIRDISNELLASDDWLLDAALAGDEARIEAALRHRSIAARGSLAVAAALLNRAAVDALLAVAGGTVDGVAGRRGWTPLLYACASRVRRAGAERVYIARRLIALGADVHVVARWPADATALEGATEWSRQGEDCGVLDLAARSSSARAARGTLGTAYELAQDADAQGVARPANTELIELLIAAGADVKSGEFVAAAVSGGRLEILRLALDAGAPWYWSALVACVEHGRPHMAELLVPRAEHARVLEPALAAAIRGGADLQFIEILLGDGRLALSAPVWQSAYRLAVRYGHAAAAQLLLQRGASEEQLTTVDRVLGACVINGRAERHPSLAFTREDHLLVPWAVRQRRSAALSALLEIGLNPNLPDRDGQAPLHLAVRAEAREPIDALLAARARLDVLDYAGRTPLDLATDPDLRQRLLDAGASPVSTPDREDMVDLFERAADAVTFGDLDGLRALLDEEPALVHARSHRSHRATLLHYCAANGTEEPRQRTPSNAPAIARLLLERGADPNAECPMYRGGDTTMALLLTSAFPAKAGLDGDLVRELARAGAEIRTVRGQGPVIDAITYGRPRAVDALVEAGLSVDDLLVAAAADRVDVIESLLAQGIDVNTRFAYGWTALHAAAATGRVKTVELLLQRHADPTLREERFGGIPAGNARYCGQEATAELIEKSTRGR